MQVAVMQVAIDLFFGRKSYSSTMTKMRQKRMATPQITRNQHRKNA